MVCGRGTQSTLRARGRRLAWSCGPSTSPLERMREILSKDERSNDLDELDRLVAMLNDSIKEVSANAAS